MERELALVLAFHWRWITISKQLGPIHWRWKPVCSCAGRSTGDGVAFLRTARKPLARGVFSASKREFTERFALSYADCILWFLSNVRHEPDV